jgi:hypothetical protein
MGYEGPMSGSSRKPFSRPDARGPTEISPESAFRPERVRRFAEKLEVHDTPEAGSWLNMAEIELSVLARQSLDRQIESAEVLVGEVEAWEMDRNERMVGVN